jgi:hypothetical protein
LKLSISLVKKSSVTFVKKVSRPSARTGMKWQRERRSFPGAISLKRGVNARADGERGSGDGAGLCGLGGFGWVRAVVEVGAGLEAIYERPRSMNVLADLPFEVREIFHAARLSVFRIVGDHPREMGANGLHAEGDELGVEERPL